MSPKFCKSRAIAILFAAIFVMVCAPRSIRAINPAMTLGVTSFEAGISYRDVQWHAPVGMITNPCSQADIFEPTIDWGDGTGEHKPDTNIQRRPFYRENQTPIVENGVYLFWDDSHRFARAGTYGAKTNVTLHCLGDPPGNQEIATQTTVNAYARVPVNQVEFTQNDKEISEVAGHGNVDITVTLNAAAPPSGTWVKLEASPAGTFSSLPPYYHISPQQSQETIRNLEVRKPSTPATLVVTASTVGRAQETDQLIITP